jgi:AraC family transcriptional regulator
MMIASTMVPSGQGVPQIAAELASSLVELLECARKDIDGDQKAALASITRASSLLRVALDRNAHGEGENSAPGTLAGWQMHRVKVFVDDHLDHTIHIKDLAAVAQRSNAYFCRAFKRTFGETPHAFIIRRRLTRASHLMLASDLALSEIALSCGFTDQAHLSKLFRQCHGQSPAAWRRERQAAGETAAFAALAPGRHRISDGTLLALD